METEKTEKAKYERKTYKVTFRATRRFKAILTDYARYNEMSLGDAIRHISEIFIMEYLMSEPKLPKLKDIHSKTKKTFIPWAEEFTTAQQKQKAQTAVQSK